MFFFMFCFLHLRCYCSRSHWKVHRWNHCILRRSPPVVCGTCDFDSIVFGFVALCWICFGLQHLHCHSVTSCNRCCLRTGRRLSFRTHYRITILYISIIAPSILLSNIYLIYSPQYVIYANYTMGPRRSTIMDYGGVTLNPHPTTIFGQQPIVLRGDLAFQ